MDFDILSARRLVRLANNNNLPLLLRHAWRERCGRDPYNDLRTIVAISNAKRLFFFFCLLGVAEFFFGIIAYPGSPFRELDYRLQGLVVVSAVMMALFGTIWSSLESNRKRQCSMGEEFRHYVSEFLYVCKQADNTLEDAAEYISSLTPDDLKLLAKNAVFGAVADVEEHDKDSEVYEGNAGWQETKARLMKKFQLATTACKVFKLIYGEDKELFKEGRRRWAAKGTETASVA